MENLPVIYGEKKGGGHTPVEAADTLSSKQTMRLLFALSEGQIDSVEDILVNSASISNYSSTVDYEVRQGTVDQTVIKGFSEVEAPLTGGGVFPVELKAGIQHIYSLLGMYDAARINLTIPRLMQVTDLGDRVGYTVTLSVYKRHQPFGGSPGSWQLASTITKNGKCTNPYSWDVRLEKPDTTGELDSWGIMIVRDSADDSNDKHYSTTALSAITTIVESSLTYPHTALVGVTLKDAAQFGGSIPEIKFKVKGIKLPLPVNYNPTTRAYTGVWNGAFKSVREYTDNLAWITYWVLREHGSTFLDSEWGLEIAASDIDVGSFYLYAQYCDQLVSDGKGGQEPRYTAHFQFIERDNVPTFLTYLLNLGNANFSSNSLGQISIIWDGAGQSITKVVSNATVVDGVFEYSSNDLEGRTNLVNVTYAREELFGDSDTATHYEQTLIDRYGLQTSDVVLFGCKSEAQALRKARAVLYNNCYATDLVTFRQLFQGASYQIGELVSVMDSDNVVTDPKHGIIIESSLLAGTTTLALDRSIVLTNASYTIQFIGNDGTTFLSKAITQTNGSFSSVTYTGSEVPFVGGTVLFSTTALTPRTVKVIKVDKDDEHVYTVTGLTHNESKYSYIETVGSIATPSGSFINFNNFTVPAVSNITVDEVFSSNGVVEFSKLAVDWDWNVSGTEDYRATFDISYRRDNQEYQQARNLGTSDFDIEYPLPGVYDIYIWAVNPFSGLRSVVTTVAYNFRVASATSTLLPPTNVVVPNTAGVVFQQRDLPLTWTFPVANDTKVDKLKDYVVQVLDYATSTVKGTYTVAPNTAKGGDFLLTFAENAAIFGTSQRQFRVRVFSRDLVGDLSNYVEVVPNNPAPVLDVTPTVSAVFGAAYIKATIPSDPDLVSYTFKKYSAATGGTLLGTITTVSNYVDFEATAGTEYYYTVTPNDSFGTGTESTRTASTALSAEIDTYTYTGLQFTPNSPTNNYVAWSSFVAIKDGSTNVTVNAGNAQWTDGTLYLYYIPGDTTFHSTTSAITAIAAGGRILATYKGGTEITADAGKAFISGDQLIAGSLLSNALATNTAYITNMAQIGNIIESDNYKNSGGSYTGWRIDKGGTATFNSIIIQDSDGNVTMASGGAVWDYISNPSGTKPANNATVGATWGTNISGQPSNDLILNNLQTGAWVVGQTPPWVLNGTSAENAIDYDTDVNGVKVPVWKCIANADGNESGGWYKNEGDPSFGKNWFKVDKNKPYRFAVPVKITGGSTGSYYWGIGENSVCDLNTSNKNSNPYFVYGGRSGLVANRWYLLVGYVFPAGSTGNTNAGSGIFDLTTGELVAERWNYCWASDVEYTGTRAYQFYCANAGETQVFGYPTVEIVDGTESKLFDNLDYAALLNAQQKWSDVGGIGKPADYADVTNYNDTRVSNVIEENNTLLVSRPVGASFNNNQGAVTGMIRIILPQGFTDTMMKFTVNVYTYSQDKSFSLNLAGYNHYNSGAWYNTEANLLGSTAADNRVRFGYDSTLGKCCIYIGEPTSSWSIPKVMVKDFIAGYSNFARSQWETGWAIDIVTSAPQNVSQDYADALIDAASIRNQGALATKSSVSYGSDITNLPGLGVNRLVNTDFKGITGWFQGWNPGGANITYFNDSTTIWGSDAYWRPKGGNALAIQQTGIGSNDIAIDIYNGGTWNSNDQRIAVKPNTKYEFSARIAAHRCIGIEMIVAVFNSNGDHISNWSLPYGSWYVPDTGGPDINNYTQYSVFFISDPTAAYVQLVFRKGNTQAGQEDSWMWITQPYFGEAAPSQTTASAYVPGAAAGAFANLNQINSTNASTYIANAAIRAAQIGSLSLTGNNFNVKSATSGARMEMDNNVIKVYDASNVLRVKLGNLSA